MFKKFIKKKIIFLSIVRKTIVQFFTTLKHENKSLIQDKNTKLCVAQCSHSSKVIM